MKVKRHFWDRLLRILGGPYLQEGRTVSICQVGGDVLKVDLISGHGVKDTKVLAHVVAQSGLKGLTAASICPNQYLRARYSGGAGHKTHTYLKSIILDLR